MIHIQLFVASSREHPAERQMLSTFVRETNDLWRPDDRYLEFISSDDYQTSLAQQGSQNVLDESIRRADVFLMMFKTRVGSYTAHEFEIAYEQYHRTGKPLIFVYQNVGSVSLASVPREDIEGLYEFKDRLAKQGDYLVEYANPDALVLAFSNQLERYVAKLTSSPQPTVQASSPAATPQPTGESLDDVTRRTLLLDETLVEAVRDMQHLEPARRRTIYARLLKGSVVDFDMSARQFFPGYLATSAKQLAVGCLEHADLRIEVARDLSTLAYKWQDHVIEVDEPKLMWNCHCGVLIGRRRDVPEAEASLGATCPIHRHRWGAQLTDVYQSGVVVTSYDGHCVIWKRSAEVWPPTIDSFAMCRNMAADGVLTGPYPTVLDLGCGTGFLGLYVAQRNSNVRHILLADWLSTPLLYAMMSMEMEPGRWQNKSMTPLLGLNTGWLWQEEDVPHADLCVCNPPYLPSFDDFPEISLYHTVGGTELLEHVIERSTDIARVTYVNFSDMALPEAQAAAERAGRVLRPVGEPYLVPFTVPQAFRHEGYVERLVKEQRVLAGGEGGYKWWHWIRTYAIDQPARPGRAGHAGA
jgi:hypothetical protein